MLFRSKIDLDAKLVLFNKLVDDLKSENESLKMHAKCLIAEPVTKTEENICCNHVVVPNCVFYLKGQIGVHSSTQKKSKSGEECS